MADSHTTMTNKNRLKNHPCFVGSDCEKATKFRFPALNINSTPMSAMTAFVRVKSK